MEWVGIEESKGDMEWLIVTHEALATHAYEAAAEGRSQASTIGSILSVLATAFGVDLCWLLGPLGSSAETDSETVSTWQIRGGDAGFSACEEHRVSVSNDVAFRIAEMRLRPGPIHSESCFLSGARVGQEVRMMRNGPGGRQWVLGIQGEHGRRTLANRSLAIYSDLVSRIVELVDADFARRELARVHDIENAVWHQSHDGLVLVSADGECSRANHAASQLLGRSESEISHSAAKEWLPAGVETVPGAAPPSWKGLLKRPSGISTSVEITQSQVETTGDPISLFQIIDKGGVAALEAQLQQLQHHRLMGRLSSGVVHDINNLLTVVMAAVEVAERDPNDKYFAEILEDGNEALQRCESLCRQLLSIGRKRARTEIVMQPDQSIAGMRTLLDRSVPDDTEIKYSLGAAAAEISVPSGTIEQVVLNLLVWAQDAGHQGGAMEVSTRVDSGHYVLSLDCEGPGLSEEELQLLFVSDHSRDGATSDGLGASVVQALVTQVGGQIGVRTSAGRGITVEVRFSLVVEPEAVAEAPSVAPSMRGDGKRVLLCENNQVLRRVMQRALHDQGYEVIDSADGKQGLERIEKEGRVDALVTDILMPNIGGYEIAKACNQNGQSTPVVFVSGLPERDELPDLGVPSKFLAKPFRMGDLIEALHGVLGSR